LQQLNEEKLKNKKLEEEIQTLRNFSKMNTINIQNQMSQLLIASNNNLQSENNSLKVENNNLKLIIANFKQLNQFNFQNNQTNQIYINTINILRQIINQKDKEINELKLKYQKNLVYMKDIMIINFISTDQAIQYGIPCLKEDTFAEVEEKLYQQFNEYRDSNNIFLFRGNQILRFKKIKENNIHNGDIIQLVRPE